MRSLLSMLLISAWAGCGSATALTPRSDASINEDASMNDIASHEDAPTLGQDAGDGAPPACGAASIDCGPPDARQEVASIHVTPSTNSGATDVAVFSDASAERSVGTNRMDASVWRPEPKSYPPGSPEVAMFLRDLATVGGVSAIPADPGNFFPTLPSCGKSVSSGTITTITAGGKTSGDLQCLDHPTAAATALAYDASVLSGMR